ncbi:MAG: iron ABC transporter permease [Bacteroidota bacterium]|nr:iron ABC transporter permease [Bacteroidota bacterium]
MNNRLIFLLSVLLLIFLFFINISIGSVWIAPFEVFKILFTSEHTNQTWEYIILNYRIPKAVVAVLSGIGLSVSGLLLQTLFRNSLAGPYVLGISSGASLGVAIVILGAFLFPLSISKSITSDYGIAIAAISGSALVLTSILIASYKIRNTMSLLIIGLMFGSITSAVVNILSYFSSGDELKKYTIWTLGNLGNHSWQTIVLLSLCTLLGLFLCISIIKPLNALLLGEKYAQSMGTQVNLTKNKIIIITSILTGSITAFVGPIAFVGLAIPHITKLLFNKADHKILLFGTLFLGASCMLICDSIAQMPGFNFVIPINAVTSIIGAPIVIWLLFKRNN